MLKLNSLNLSLKEKILLTLTLSVDKAFNTRRFPFNSSGGDFSFPFSYDLAVDRVYDFLMGGRNVFYSTISKMVREKLISKEVNGKKSFIKIADLGRDFLSEKFPRLFLKTEKWDENWRIIVFDVPERDRNKRHKLRKMLLDLSCVFLFDSLWLSPNNVFPLVESFANIYHIEGCLSYIIGRISEKDQEKAVKLVGIEAVNEGYKRILIDLKDKRQWKGYGTISGLGSRFLGVYAKDPRWPRELLPKDWMGEKIRKLVVGEL